MSEDWAGEVRYITASEIEQRKQNPELYMTDQEFHNYKVARDFMESEAKRFQESILELTQEKLKDRDGIKFIESSLDTKEIREYIESLRHKIAESVGVPHWALNIEVGVK